MPTPFRPLRVVPETLGGARDFTVPKGYRTFRAASTYTTFGGSHPFDFFILKQKTDLLVGFCLVGAGGFEPPKSKTTDLQSAPFGHSGTLPYLVTRWSWWTDATFFTKSLPCSRQVAHTSHLKTSHRDIFLTVLTLSGFESDVDSSESGAGGRTRTPDLLITNQLLYQLSYTSVFKAPN